LSAYLIAYDLRGDADSSRYEALQEAIKAYGTWAHVTESCWIIVTEEKAKEVRDGLAQWVTPGDRLFVLKSASVAAWRNVICRSEWLKENI